MIWVMIVIMLVVMGVIMTMTVGLAAAHVAGRPSDVPTFNAPGTAVSFVGWVPNDVHLDLERFARSRVVGRLNEEILGHKEP